MRQSLLFLTILLFFLSVSWADDELDRVINDLVVKNEFQDLFINQPVQTTLWDHLTSLFLNVSWAEVDVKRSKLACYPVEMPTIEVSQDQLKSLYELASSKISVGPINLSQAKEAYELIESGNVHTLTYSLTSKAGTMVFGNMISSCMLQVGCLILQNMAMSTVNNNLAIQFDEEALRNLKQAKSTDALVKNLSDQQGHITYVDADSKTCIPE